MIFLSRRGLLIILFLLSFKSTATGAILVDRIVGVIDGEVITYSDLQIERIFRLSEGGDIEILQWLIDRRLLLREAERFNITETEEDIKKIHQRLEDIKREMGEDRFYKILGEYNLKDSNILKIIKEKIVVDRFIDFRINFFVVISDDAIKTYYNYYKNKFGGKALEDVYQQIKVRLLQIESKRKLEDYLDQLRRKAKISINL